MQIAIVTVSDRASRGEYEDLSGPLIETWLARDHVVLQADEADHPGWFRPRSR